MDCTLLNLLIRDGMVTIEFTPALANEHYTQLPIVTKDASTAGEMQEVLEVAADRWFRAVRFG